MEKKKKKNSEIEVPRQVRDAVLRVYEKAKRKGKHHGVKLETVYKRVSGMDEYDLRDANNLYFYQIANAVRNLRQSGLITYEHHGYRFVTQEERDRAEEKKRVRQEIRDAWVAWLNQNVSGGDFSTDPDYDDKDERRIFVGEGVVLDVDLLHDIPGTVYCRVSRLDGEYSDDFVRQNQVRIANSTRWVTIPFAKLNHWIKLSREFLIESHRHFEI